MPKIQLKLEVSPGAHVTFWSVDVDAGKLLLGVADFAPTNHEGFFVWDKPIDIAEPTLPIKLHTRGVGSSIPAFTPVTVCYVTINTVLQEHYLRCLILGGEPTADDRFLYDVPKGGLPPATLFVLPAKNEFRNSTKAFPK
jgi:hypothetical protein